MTVQQQPAHIRMVTGGLSAHKIVQSILAVMPQRLPA